MIDKPTQPTTEHRESVQTTFTNIAKKYDLMNDIISLGSHRIIKKKAMLHCQFGRDCNLLDLAAGTGDLSIYFRENDKNANKIVLTDPNIDMLNYAKIRLAKKQITTNIKFISAFAEDLPFPDESFSNVSIGFGFRNFTEKDKSLREIHRILIPNGRLIIIDFSKPTNPIINKLNTIYLDYFVPLLGRIIAGNSSEYKYLAKSIAEHPSQDQIINMLESSGYKNCKYENKLNGIIAIHYAKK